jgi:hypothetical protein
VVHGYAIHNAPMPDLTPVSPPNTNCWRRRFFLSAADLELMSRLAWVLIEELEWHHAQWGARGLDPPVLRTESAESD